MTIHGRADQLAALQQALSALPAQGRLILVRGPRGIGRTSLLRAQAAECRTAGVPVVEVEFSPGRSGFRAVLAAIGESPPTAAGSQLVSLTLQVGTAVDKAAREAPLVVIADDATLAPDAALALDAARRPGVLVIATAPAGRPDRVADQLAALADRVIDLPPVLCEHRSAMIADRFGAPPDAALDQALDVGLGTLAGCPAAVLDAAAELVRLGRVVQVHDRLCLARPDLPLPVSAVTAELFCAGLTAQARSLLTRIAVDPVRSAELPARIPADAEDRPGLLSDQLIEDGLLSEAANGRLHLASPAVAAWLIDSLGEAEVTGRRRDLARDMLCAHRAGADIDLAELGDRFARYPTAPGDAPVLPLLLALIERTGTDPSRRADWLRAAWERTGDAGLRHRLAGTWLRELVSAGRFRSLGDAVVMVLAAGPVDTAVRGELAAAAMLAALHTGVPVPESVQAAVGATSTPIRFACRWFAGEAPAGIRATAADPPAALITTQELAHVARLVDDGGDPGDLATAFEAVLTAERYRCGTDNLLGAYRRVLRGYRAGDFSDALTAARELELIGSGDTAPHQLARVWASEMCGWTGAHQDAERWLSTAGGPAADPALLTWAACGRAELMTLDPAPPGTPVERSIVDHARQALADGVRAYGEIAVPSRIGLALLIPRLCGLAVRAGDAATLRQLVRDLESRRAGDAHPLLDEASAAVRSLTARSAAAAGEAAMRAATGDDRPARLRLLLAAVLGSASPEILTEAYQAACDLSATAVTALIVTAMDRQGLREPPVTGFRFTALEKRILEQISAGRTNRQIGRSERLSEKTVEEYVSRLLTRTGVRNRVQLAVAVLTGQIGQDHAPADLR